MKALLIDDLRNPDYVASRHGVSVTAIARNYQAGITALKNDKWDVLFLDHDLADFDENGREKDGMHILDFLEEFPEYLPKKIQLVTMNPVERIAMQRVIDKLYG